MLLGRRFLFIGVRIGCLGNSLTEANPADFPILCYNETWVCPKFLHYNKNQN